MASYGVAALILWGLEMSRILQGVNLLVYDYVTHLSPAPSGQSKPIVIIGISESDIKTYGWPIDDSLLCEAVDRLSGEGVKAIGLDLYRDKGIGAQQNCLRETIRRNSAFDRAWYNLGLLLAQTGRSAEAVQALQTAERTAPGVADYPYARATILWQQGDRAGAKAAAELALRINPAHPGARQLVEQR